MSDTDYIQGEPRDPSKIRIRWFFRWAGLRVMGAIVCGGGVSHVPGDLSGCRDYEAWQEVTFIRQT